MFDRMIEVLGLDHAIRPIFRGNGVVLMFHRVVAPAKSAKLQGLKGIEVSPEFFRAVLDYFSSRKFTWLGLDELAAGLAQKKLPKKFACITFDDGYLDNIDYVAPLLKTRGLPWSVFVTTNFIDRKLKPWWYALEWLILQGKGVDFKWLDSRLDGPTIKGMGPEAAFNHLRQVIHTRLGTPGFQAALDHWLLTTGCPIDAFAAALAMNWADVRALADFGCDVGAHTINHLPLSRLPEQQMALEIEDGIRRLSLETGRQIQDFAYPFGDAASCGSREFQAAKAHGVRLAFTTRHGWIFPGHQDHSWALPRVNVSGHFRSLRHFESRLNGLTNLLHHQGQRMVTA